MRSVIGRRLMWRRSKATAAPSMFCFVSMSRFIATNAGTATIHASTGPVVPSAASSIGVSMVCLCERCTAKARRQRHRQWGAPGE